jgi:hypothetical protein
MIEMDVRMTIRVRLKSWKTHSLAVYEEIKWSRTSRMDGKDKLRQWLDRRLNGQIAPKPPGQ